MSTSQVQDHKRQIDAHHDANVAAINADADQRINTVNRMRSEHIDRENSDRDSSHAAAGSMWLQTLNQRKIKLENERKAIEVQNNKLKVEEQHVNAVGNELETKKKLLDQQREQMHQSREKVDAEFNDHVRNITKLKDNINELEEKKRMALNAAKDAETKIKNNEAVKSLEMEKLKESLKYDNDIKTNQRNVSNEIATLQSQLNAAKANKDQHVRGRDTLTSDGDAIEQTLKTIGDQLKEATVDKETNVRNLSKAKQDVATTERAAAVVKSSSYMPDSEKMSKLQDLAETANTHRKEVSDFSNKVAAASNAITSLAAENGLTSKRLTMVNNAINKVNNNINTANTAVDHISASISQAQSNAANLQSQQSNNEQEIATHKREIASNDAQIQESRNMINQKTTEHNDAHAAAVQSATEVRKREHEMGQLHTQNEQLKTKMAHNMAATTEVEAHKSANETKRVNVEGDKNQLANSASAYRAQADKHAALVTEVNNTFIKK